MCPTEKVLEHSHSLIYQGENDSFYLLNFSKSWVKGLFLVSVCVTLRKWQISTCCPELCWLS